MKQIESFIDCPRKASISRYEHNFHTDTIHFPTPSRAPKTSIQLDEGNPKIPTTLILISETHAQVWKTQPFITSADVLSTKKPRYIKPGYPTLVLQLCCVLSERTLFPVS